MHTVQQESFVRNLISSLSSKQFFDEIKFLTKFFNKTASVRLEISMNVKINDTPKSDDRTTEKQMSDDRC